MESTNPEVSTTTLGIPTTTTSDGFRFDWNGINFLLVIIYGGIIIVLIVFFIKRAIHRRVHIRFAQTQKSGSGAPKKLLNKINQQLDNSGYFNYEPKLLLPNDERLVSFDNSHSDNLAPNYLFRMKTVDGLCEIDEKLSKVNKVLMRPMGKSIKQHLFDAKSHSSGCLRSIRSNQLQATADSYLHARYGAEVYQKEEYLRFVNLSGEITNSLNQQISYRPKSKKTASFQKHSDKKHHSIKNEASNNNMQSGSTDPFLPTSSNEEPECSENLSYFELESDEKKLFLNRDKKK